MKKTILMTFALLCTIAQGAWAQNSYSYYECSWNGSQVEYTKRYTSGSIDDISDDKYSSGGDLHANTYSYFVATKSVTIHNGLTTDGNVKLILLDGVTLTVEGNGLTVPEGSSLTIYAQSYGSNPGKLIARSDNDDNAGIGSKKRTITGDITGDITIHGGYIEAHGGKNGAGIGGGLEAYGPNQIIIYDGTVKAYGGNNGAGIGGGAEGYTRNVSIYGGNITAQGGSRGAGIGGGYFAEGTKYAFDRLYFTGNARVEARGGDYAAGIGGGQSGSGGYVTVDGGYIDAYGGTDAAGIGSGEKTSYGDDINGGKLTVNGGRVYANGKGWGAGIGGGEDAKGAEVVINGGTVIALAGSDAGDKNGSAIGSEDGDGRRGTLSIADKMMVHAGQTFNGPHNLFSYGERVPACYFRPYTRIEVCNHEGKTYTINGTGADGKHKLNCSHCLDRTEEKHNFPDANSACTVCGVEASVSTISFYIPEAGEQGYVDGGYSSSPKETQTVVTGSTVNLPTPPVSYLPLGVEFAGWAVGTPTTPDTYWKNNETVYTSYTVSENMSFKARYTAVDITLADATDNGEALYNANGKTAQTVTLAGRTLYKDGDWNTLCLPFSMRADQVASDLAGATLMKLSSSSFTPATGELLLTFETVTSIEAGKPYIVKWETPSENHLVNPVFNSVVISNEPAPTTTDYVDFIGTFSPETIYRTVEADNETPEQDKSYLYLGGYNTLYYPTDTDFKVNAFRAYFKLKGLTAGILNDQTTNSPTPNTVRSFVLNFGDEETGITTTNYTNDTNSDGAWYSVDGRRLTGKPTARGLYIRSTSGSLQGKNNGKKVFIK